MTDHNPNVDHHLAELRQVADELRAARAVQGPGRSPVGAVRTAIGRAFLAAATALLADGTSSRLALR